MVGKGLNSLFLATVLAPGKDLHVCSEPCETLSAAAPHPQEEGVAQRLPDDPRDPTDVSDGIQEEHELHLGRVHLVVVIEVLLQDLLHLRMG